MTEETKNDAAAAKAAQQSKSTDGDPAKEAAAKEADAAAAKTREAQIEAAKAAPVGTRPQAEPAPEPAAPLIQDQAASLTVTPALDNPEGIIAQHDQVAAENEKRNERNREGFEKLMKLEEARAEEAHARTEHFQDARAGFVPTGKQRDVNTPEILPDGTKVWR